MTSVDELFRKPLASNGKRKHETPHIAAETSYKSTKYVTGDVKEQQPSAEDESDDEAGPQPPDDDEGRFFGGGINSDTAEILDFVGEQDAETAPEKIDSSWLKKAVLNFEKHINKNAELRAKFEHEPSKFMASEADLDADIKSLSILAEHSELYQEFVKLGSAASLVSLLAHENTDIAIDAIQIIAELTDDDVAEGWEILVDAMLEADLPALLVQNLNRLDETNESDEAGVYHVLNVIENLASKQSISEEICKTSITTWLLARIQSNSSQNQQYAMEILAILAQLSANREQMASQNAVDLLLQVLSKYRTRDTKGEEEEFVENLWDCLMCLSTHGFVEAEGVELCLIMIKEGKMGKRALRLLDHAQGLEVCERIVEVAGLKTVFGLFIKKQDKETIEHILGIFYSMFRWLPGQSASRIRMMAKFVEKDFQKLTKLLNLRDDFARRADEYCLQTTDVILAWMVAEDDGARRVVKAHLAQRDENLSVIKATIETQLGEMGEGGEEAVRDMLNTLKEFLVE